MICSSKSVVRMGLPFVLFSSFAWAELSVQELPVQESAAPESPSVHEMADTESQLSVEVRVKKNKVRAASMSRNEMSQKQIQKLPQGGEVSLPKLLTSTSAGAVQGPFGQVFFRGNHANIQYQIDGVQMPESGSSTFGATFSPRNIDYLEVITGGVPAEYGQRLGAVVNVITQSGPETPSGELELNYGTYNTVSPHLLYGGSNEKGDLRYFLSLNYLRTDRGLDSIHPVSPDNVSQGGTDVVHNTGIGHTEFGRVDWQVDNQNKLTFNLFNSQNQYQLPNHPASFTPNLPYFARNFQDSLGIVHEHSIPYRAFAADANQSERNTYFQLVWKRTLDTKSFFQLAPYYKNSNLVVRNDPANDLIRPTGGSRPLSLAMDRQFHNLGLKGDYSLRLGSQHLVKTGFQLQGTRSDGFVSVQRDINTPAQVDRDPNTGYFESVYLQDDFSITQSLVLNAGLRFDATQFLIGGSTYNDHLLQPRLGLSYLVTDSTKVHGFYGKLFQPAPLEALRVTFDAVEGNGIQPYDIKAEKDDYFEVGVLQKLGSDHTAGLTVYYRNGVNILDDAQLLNTAIAQPFNFATGFAYGAEFSLKGQWSQDWSHFFNYSYSIAKGKDISGGAWATDIAPSGAGYQMLDHVQEHTANAGLTYSKNGYWATAQGIFGSGLRSGHENAVTLPSHLTFDFTIGREFEGPTGWGKFKVSADVLNIFNNVYPITIANEFSNSQYAAGRQFFLRLTKVL